MKKSGEANDGALPSKKPLPLGHYDYASSNDADWRPWGLYDHKHIPQPSEAAFCEALHQLGIEKDDKRRRARLLKSLRAVAVLYWKTRRGFERPPLRWYRRNIQPVRRAARKFVAHFEPKNRRELSGLDRRMQIEMKRRLLKSNTPGGDLESIEQLVRQFIRICDRVLQEMRDGSGRPSHTPVVAAAHQTVKLWEKVSRKRMGLSLDTTFNELWQFGPEKQTLLYPGPLFVQTVLQGIDSSLNIGTIGTALRNVRKLAAD